MPGAQRKMREGKGSVNVPPAGASALPPPFAEALRVKRRSRDSEARRETAAADEAWKMTRSLKRILTAKRADSVEFSGSGAGDQNGTTATIASAERHIRPAHTGGPVQAAR